MILARLREHTRAAHQRLEARVDILACSLSLSAYRELLNKFYGFYVPLECRLAGSVAGERVDVPSARTLGQNAVRPQALNTSLNVELKQELKSNVNSDLNHAFSIEKMCAARRKVPLLVRDFHALGVGPDQLAALPRCCALPTLQTLPQVWGCLYVVEGATLGGQIISRHLQERLGLDATNGAAFFHGYGSETGRMWRTFGNALTHYTEDGTEEEVTLILQAAIETFAAFDAWFAREETLPMRKQQSGEMPVTDGDRTYLSPQERVDVINCDREPIHIINHVQPHGALVALNPGDLTIVQASENTRTLLGVAAEDLTGQPADRLFAPEHIQELRRNVAEALIDANPLYLFSAHMAGQGPFHIIAHVYLGVLILEIEPVTSEDASPDYYALIKKTLARFEGARTVNAFAQMVCEEVRRISGFDRVMVYRFLDDHSGDVIAEDLAPEQQGLREPFLGLRYPASDIPKQARALFVLNAVRLIPDVHYVPAALIPAVNAATGRPCDLSYTFLRGVSPMHVEYLGNMGVRATMSLAIVRDGQLWGLIACHHHTPRRVAYDVRTACEFLARVVSLQITEKEMTEQAEYRRHIEEMHHSLIAHMGRIRALLPALIACEPDIKTFVDCGGSAVVLGSACHLFGATPDEAQVRALAAWLATEHPEEVYATNTLPAEYPPAQALKATACGVLALQMSYGGGGYILWFRPEVVQTVNWGGDPAKPVVTSAEGDRLTPRKSFALWQETVTDSAIAWKTVEIEAARRLRVSVVEAMARLAEELAQTNQKLAKSNVELDAFAYIASHDLKEPRGIYNFSHFLKEDYGKILPDEGQEQLDTVLRLTRRMEALIDSLLYYSRVGRLELVYQECDLNAVIKEVLESLQLRVAETGTAVRVPRLLPLVVCDRVQISEVFHNLMQNALKYNNKPERWMEIGYLNPSITEYTFYVKDNGIGIEPFQHEAVFRIFKRLHGRDEYGGGSGAGPTIARKIVERHNGQLWVESTPGEGSTFLFYIAKGAEMNHQPTTSLLVVEDSDEDYKTLMRIFRKLALAHPVHRCANAKECFDYLYGTGKHKGRSEEDLPSVVLLDLNLPGMDGHGVLQQVKSEPALKCLPVVIITTSANPKDVQTCYEEGASSYLVKPMDYDVFEQTIRRFVDYWFQAVRLPIPGEAV